MKVRPKVAKTKLHEVDVAELLEEAKSDIQAGESRLRAAAEKLAAAEKKGATQRQIAHRVGKSVAWVNRLLKWREDGYKEDTAFGPSSKASRQRARVQATERNSKKQRGQKAQAAAAETRARKAKADAETAEAEARKAEEKAAKARAEAAKAEAEADKAAADRRKARAWKQASGDTNENKLESGQRERLVKVLGMLGSAHAGERANAASVVEQVRRRLDMTWDELIVPAAATAKMAA